MENQSAPLEEKPSKLTRYLPIILLVAFGLFLNSIKFLGTGIFGHIKRFLVVSVAGTVWYFKGMK